MVRITLCNLSRGKLPIIPTQKEIPRLLVPIGFWKIGNQPQQLGSKGKTPYPKGGSGFGKLVTVK
jgi:hypothetical protein